MSLRFDWVFFDAVDTLFRVRGSVGEVYAKAAQRHGVDADPAAIEVGFRRAMRSAPPLCFPGAAPGELEPLERQWWRQVVSQSFAGLGSFAAFEAFFATVFDLFGTAAPWELCEGARDVPAALRRAGARLAVVSDMDGRLPGILAAFGLLDEFETVVLASRTGTRKHAGTLFAHALARTGARPGAVAHVGDNVRTDIAGAQAAGITPVHFDPQARGGAPPGVAVVHSLLDLPRMLSTPARL